MTEKSEKKITFRLEGDAMEYVLEFDFNAVCDAEVETGCNLMKPLTGRGITAAETRALLYALLKTNHPRVLLAEAGALLNQGMDVVLGALAQAIKTSGTVEIEPGDSE